MLSGLEQKTVLVTGCATGIGQAICRAFAERKSHVVGIYNATDYSQTESLVKQFGVAFTPVYVDMSSTVQFTDIVKDIAQEVGRIDFLINNAGLNKRSLALEITLQEWSEVLNVNLTSPLFLSQAMAQYWIKNNIKGKIVNILSLLAFKGGYFTTGYTASKHALLGLTKILANEWGQYQINVNAIAPGYIETDMTKPFIENKEVSENFFKRISLNRWGKPNDISQIALFLCSSAANYIQGQTIIVDGGFMNI
jgi:2-deoxy-D-gluconate 3-dehydrogenase